MRTPTLKEAKDQAKERHGEVDAVTVLPDVLANGPVTVQQLEALRCVGDLVRAKEARVSQPAREHGKQQNADQTQAPTRRRGLGQGHPAQGQTHLSTTPT